MTLGRPDPGALPWARGGVPFVVRDADRIMIATFSAPELAERAVASVNACASARAILEQWRRSFDGDRETLDRLYELLGCAP